MDVEVRVEPPAIRAGEPLNVVLANRGSDDLLYGPSAGYEIERRIGDRWSWVTFDLPPLPEPAAGEMVAYARTLEGRGLLAGDTNTETIRHTAHLEPGRHRVVWEMLRETGHGPPDRARVSAEFDVVEA